MIVGIDLGTTNSLIGVWKDGEVELIPNALGSVLTPSAVYVDENSAIHVGMAARERLVSSPNRAAAAFKRYMGTGRRFILGSCEFGAVELSALVLRSLKEDAERHLKQAVTEAIVTVPAYFNDFQRQATKAAAEIAGLKVDRLLNEPTAAALAYGMHEERSEKKVLVLDLGGGTFDVSILEMFEGVMEVRAAAGDNQLGGEDFTNLLVDLFIKEVGAAAGIPPRSQPVEIHGALRRQMEIVKRELSDRPAAEARLAHDGKELAFLLSRERFEALSEPLLARLRAPIERAIRDAKLTPEEITHLVLVGGATRMRMIRHLAARLFHHLPASHTNPDEAIACGAAIQAGLMMRDAALDDVVMTDVAPFTLGVASSWQDRSGQRVNGVFSPIIERNTVIPASRSRQYCTTAENQTSVTVKILQGESRFADDNIELGRFMVSVPPRPAGTESFELRFTYDVSGLLEAEATNSQGQKFQLVIEGNGSTLSREEVAERLAAFTKLKIHPRDQAQNQALLARAARLYEERLGDLREAIGNSINLFRAILERQDEEEIGAHRRQLSAWLDNFDSSFFV